MAATDAYGNPGLVATDELIESAWGNAVISRVVRTYPSVAAWQAANPAPGDGQTTAIGSNLFVVRGGRLVSVSDTLTASATVAGGNVGGGGATTEVNSQLNLPLLPWDMTYAVFWTGVAAAGTSAGSISPDIRTDPATPVGGLGTIPILANGGASWTVLGAVSAPANVQKVARFFVTIGGAGLNIAGYARAIGIPG